MMVDIINNWPLMVIPLADNYALPKETSAHFLSQHRQKTIIMDIETERNYDTSRKKGAFIDI
jgi:hypothetical protein